MPAVLTVVKGRDADQSYRLEDLQSSVLGRSIKSDVRVPDPRASRSHCCIENIGGAWTLTDLGSTNGTFVNGRRVTEAPLRSGDEIRIGYTVYRFTIEDEPDAGAPGTQLLTEKERTVLHAATGGPPADAGDIEDEELELIPLGPEEDAPEAEVGQPVDDEPEFELNIPYDTDFKIGAPETPDRPACAQCGRELAVDAVATGQATEIGGRVYCSRCVVHREEETPSPAAEHPPSGDTSEIESLLHSLERATEADRVDGGPSGPAKPPTPPRKRPGLLDRLRHKKPEE